MGTLCGGHDDDHVLTPQIPTRRFDVKMAFVTAIDGSAGILLDKREHEILGVARLC